MALTGDLNKPIGAAPTSKHHQATRAGWRTAGIGTCIQSWLSAEAGQVSANWTATARRWGGPAQPGCWIERNMSQVGINDSVVNGRWRAVNAKDNSRYRIRPPKSCRGLLSLRELTRRMVIWQSVSRRCRVKKVSKFAVIANKRNPYRNLILKKQKVMAIKAAVNSVLPYIEKPIISVHFQLLKQRNGDKLITVNLLIICFNIGLN